ncbi:hypothetical protein BB560_003237 [Smittium megazygosporum]|uniref:3-oxo-5-alpha-steroid 4-dehydrogenase C-terminal domain-containing protein n=1 Tax=Smittium megazygosporum TaxID=133381 RepID=A0A2T9ZCK0_9FUNG|nr:hypothetical protein BB560_003237 [Smittium megazygosporum]
MLLAYICRSFYTIAAVSAIFFEAFPDFRSTFIHYGKVKLTSESAPEVEPETKEGSKSTTKRSLETKPQKEIKKNNVSSSLLKVFDITVSKNKFTYFYIIGTMVSSLLLQQLLKLENANSGELYEVEPPFIDFWKFLECKYSPLKAQYTSVLSSNNISLCDPFVDPLFKVSIYILGLYTIHLFLRMYETTLLQPFSPAKIHVGHFITGIIFYILTPFAVFVDGIYKNGNPPSSNTVVLLLSSTLFFYSVYKRYKLHCILYELKKSTVCASAAKKGEIELYNIPTGEWFNLISSPHYLAEILMYFSLFVMAGGNSVTFMTLLFWVVTNLTISAIETHKWYKQKFGSKYPSQRYAIFPYIC